MGDDMWRDDARSHAREESHDDKQEMGDLATLKPPQKDKISAMRRYFATKPPRTSAISRRHVPL